MVGKASVGKKKQKTKKHHEVSGITYPHVSGESKVFNAI